MSEERLEVEVQIGSTPAAVPATGDDFDLATEASRISPEVQDLIQRLLDGSEPLGRDLKQWEVLKFNPIHVNVCVLRAAGFRGVEISKILGMEQSTISVILNHPYGVKLVGALVPRGAVKVFDIKTRLEENASELLSHMYSLAMDSEDVEDVAKVTFGILDRAGYTPKTADGPKKIPGEISIPESSMRRLEKAMTGSEMVTREVMPHWVPRRPPDEGALPADDAIGSSVQGDAVHTPEQGGQQVAAGGRR